jgi:hypothetical protein
MIFLTLHAVEAESQDIAVAAPYRLSVGASHPFEGGMAGPRTGMRVTEAGMRAPTQARPEFADGPRRHSRWTRLPWAVSFVVFSAFTWWATYHHHAPIGVGVLIIIILVSLSVYSLYKAAEGNARVVSAFAGIVVLSMTLAVFQKAPPRHPGEVLTQKWAPCPANRSPMAGRAPVHPEPVSAGLPDSYGGAHIDSVIAPDGTAHVTSQELDCVTITGVQGGGLLPHRPLGGAPARPVLGALHQGVFQRAIRFGSPAHGRQR